MEELKQQNPDFPDISGGIYVHGVVPRSPADKYASPTSSFHTSDGSRLTPVPSRVHRGGLKDGDVIVKLNGKPLTSTADLQGALLQQDTPLLLEVRRDNDDLLFNIQPDVIMQ